MDSIKTIVLSIEMALYANLWRLFYVKCAKKRITCYHTRLLSDTNNKKQTLSGIITN